MPSPADSSTPTPKIRRRRSPGRALETVLLASTACLMAAVAWPIAAGGFSGPQAEWDAPVAASTPELPAQAMATEQPVIQIALLLDTSSSMDGLIDQARTQMWSVVNALDSASYKGSRSRLQIAVYEYGNDTLEGSQGWIRQVQPFTDELDVVSQALFSLTTNGGTEHAGEAIARSLDELSWAEGEGVLKVAYIAGNEGFDQGPISASAAKERASGKSVVVNTIFCGNPDEGDAAGWRTAAGTFGGRFASIDHNHVVQHIAAPQDAEIARLGQELNDTYIRYGAHGRAGLDNMVAQDNNMAGYGEGSVVQRSLAKSKRMYRNDSWDLVDALEADKVAIGSVERSDLPTELQGLDDEELAAEVSKQSERRAELQTQISELAAEREAYVAAERQRLGEDPAALDQAILGGIRDQATAAGFTLESA